MRLVPPDNWTPAGIETLEGAAYEALRHGGSATVVAGPGAGKTEFLAQRACFLLETGVCLHPAQILAISFKTGAALNLGERVNRRVPERADRFTSMTFDAFTKSILERFSPALPEHWRLLPGYNLFTKGPTKDQLSAFMDDTAAKNPTFRKELYAIPRNRFINEGIGTESLRPIPGEPTSAMEVATDAFWKWLYLDHDPQNVNFVMINRLADLIIRTNPQIRRALRFTYPYVFVDEFQDTTFAQYSFLRSVFQGTGAVVTVVGDQKQRIMGWAGALDDAFAEFESDFNARRFNLKKNFRSSDELIRIQHVFATKLDAGAAAAEAGTDKSFEGEVAEAWVFDTDFDHSRYVARWICADIENSEREPTDFVLLVKQKAGDHENRLAGEFAAVGLSILNQSQEVGQITLQDLLADDIARLLCDLTRLSTSVRNPLAWQRTVATMTVLRGATAADESGSRAVQDELSIQIKTTRRWLGEHAPNRNTADELTDELLRLVDEQAIRRQFAKYRSGDLLGVTVAAFKQRLSDVAEEASDWNGICDAFEGKDSVSLMTVHKSKGLEYHTVIILDINDKQWWSYTDDGLQVFFVGISRAERRVILTYCAESGARDVVADIYDLLADAGVPITDPLSA